MTIERLSVENLREGVFCAAGKPHGEEVYKQLTVWLDGNALRGFFAREAGGVAAGFVLYYPVEYAPIEVEGDGMYVVQCIYVKPEYQGRGIGRALVDAAVSDAAANKRSGVVALGFYPGASGNVERTPASFLEHIGMEAGESSDVSTLYYTSLNDSLVHPRFLQMLNLPKAKAGRIRVDIFDCSLCHMAASNRELVKTVISKIPEPDVELVVHDQHTRQAVVDKGMSAGVIINGTLTYFSGPINEDDLWRAIEIAHSARRAN